MAIGHYTPDYANQLVLRGEAAGTSHEVAVLEGAVGKSTRYLSRYRNTSNPEASWCAPADGWLRETREMWSQNGTIANWDTSYLGDGRANRNCPISVGRSTRRVFNGVRE